MAVASKRSEKGTSSLYILMDKAQINEYNLMVFLTYLEFLQLYT